MKWMTLASLGLALCMAASVAPSPLAAAPEPAVLPPTGVWELSFKNYAPERLEVTEKGKKVTYWYMRYTVTNNTGKDVLYTPEFQLITDTGQAITAYKGVDRSIFKKIKALYKSQLMESPFEILGKVLQGEDNARDGVAIWSGVDADARYFTILVQGLSNETSTVKNPLTGEPVVLQKALQLEYKMPGEQLGIDPAPEFKGRKWVMR